MPHEQPTSEERLNSPTPFTISLNIVGQNKICIDHDLDEADNSQCFELESVP